MEYLLQPSKTYYRFHNRFSVNRYGMRSDDFPPQKTNSNELRVLVVGDSIVYGGVRIDQSEIATEILKRNLQEHLGRPVVVGNGSAKGWGPLAELAYLQRYGTLDADVVVLELSSHDSADVPRFLPTVGVSVDFPDKRPPLALTDLLNTYLLSRYLHIGATQPGVDVSGPDPIHLAQDTAQCQQAERDFFRFAREHHAKVVLDQHLTFPELVGQYLPGYSINQAIAREENVPYTDDADELRSRLQSGRDPFFSGDLLHLNRSGQPVLAHALERAVTLALNSKD